MTGARSGRYDAIVRLLFTFAGGEGHFRPLLPLAAAAAVRGHDVTVTGAAALGPVAESAGVAFVASGPDAVPQRVPLRPIDMDREYAVLRDVYAGRFARARAADVLALCSRARPDALVRDETDFGAAIAAERLRLPHARVLVTAAGAFATPARVAQPLERLRAEHGLPADPGMTMLSRELALSPFPPSFRDPADPPAADVRTFRASEPGPEGGARSLVYVTLGTIFNTESGDLFARVVAGVRELPFEVVVTVGRAMDPAELGPQPANVTVERFVPQSRLLPRCALVVTHAGSGSVLGALEHGVPLVCIPLGADQPLNAARCEALGAGAVLDALTLTPEDVRRACCEVLTTQRYRDAAARLGAEIAAQPSAAEAVASLEQLTTPPGG